VGPAGRRFANRPGQRKPALNDSRSMTICPSASVIVTVQGVGWPELASLTTPHRTARSPANTGSSELAISSNMTDRPSTTANASGGVLCMPSQIHQPSSPMQAFTSTLGVWPGLDHRDPTQVATNAPAAPARHGHPKTSVDDAREHVLGPLLRRNFWNCRMRESD